MDILLVFYEILFRGNGREKCGKMSKIFLKNQCWSQKKVLSLVLCVAVMLSVMVLGAGAAFSDQDQIENTEAVNMCSALNIIGGYEDGSFHPERNIKRSEITKMICVALNGGKEPNVSTNVVPTFNDVRGTSAEWAEGYIESCVAQGIVSGVGGGRFAPDGNVTGTQLAKMLLVSLGYNSDNEGFTGNAWETNVNVRAAQKGLYAGLESLDTSSAVTRDQAAQMVWNAMNAYEVEYKTTIVTDENGQLVTQITVQDKVDSFFGRITLMEDKYEAQILTGTFNGNYDTGATAKEGYIDVAGNDFPYDFALSNIGEEVNVLWKDNRTEGTPEQLDEKDTVYGVYLTGGTTVYYTTKDAIQEVDQANKKIKFGDVKYDYLENQGNIVTNYGTGSVALTYGNLNALDIQSGDAIKFVCNDDGDIVSAYVTASNLYKVTSVTSSKVSLFTLGAIDIEGNDIYDGIAKDDVVVATQYYDADKNDATFVIEKAETVEGTITAYTNKNGVPTAPTKVSIDGTEYKIEQDALQANLTDDSIVNLTDHVGTTVVAYLVNGMVDALQETSDTAYNYALVLSTNNQVTAGTQVGKVQLLLSDNTKVIYDVNKDSDVQADDLAEGNLVKYSLKADNTLMVDTENLINADAGDGSDGYSVSMNGTSAWNADTKVVGGADVAASNCIAFVKTDATGGEDGYKAYNIRDLKTIAAGVINANMYWAKNTSGQVVAAYIPLEAIPGGGSKNTTYGMVLEQLGATKLDDDYYTSYSIWTGEETITVNIEGQKTDTLAEGAMYSFNRTSNDRYESYSAYFTLLDVTTNTNVKDVAVKEYDADDQILSYYNGVTEAVDGTYEGAGLATKAVDDDAKIIYVDADAVAAGDDIGINEFDITTGYANAKIVLDNDVIVAILVETSGDANINGTTDVASTYLGDTNSATAIESALTANGSATVGDADLDGNLTVDANETLIVNGTLSVGTGNTLTVNGALVVNNLDLDGGTLTGSGTVNGEKIVMGSTISGTLTIKFASASIENSATMIINMTGGSLTIAGGITGDGTATLDIQGDSSVSIAGTVQADVTVSGTASLTAGNVTGDVTNNSTGNVVVGGEVKVPEGTVKTGNLNDTRTEGKVEHLFDDYSVNVTVGNAVSGVTTVYDVALTATNLVEHQNGATPETMGHWAGISVKATEGDSYSFGWGSYSSAAQFTTITSETLAGEDPGYCTFYRDFGSAEKKDTFYVAIKDAEGNITLYNVNCANVTLAAES